jgi:hypothetical protein
MTRALSWATRTTVWEESSGNSMSDVAIDPSN